MILNFNCNKKNNLKNISSEEYEQLELELWIIRDKETKDVQNENYLQLSLKGLQERISQTIEELHLNEKKLADEVSRKQFNFEIPNSKKASNRFK